MALDEKEVLLCCGCGYESSSNTARCPDTGRNRTGISMRKCGESGLLENASRRCLLLKAHSGNCTRKPTSMLFHFCPRRGASKLISVGKRMAWRWAKRSAYSAGCGDATLKGLDAGIGACGADCWCWAHFRRVQGLSCLAYLVNYNIFNRSFCEVTFPQVSFHAYSGRNGSV